MEKIFIKDYVDRIKTTQHKTLSTQIKKHRILVVDDNESLAKTMVLTVELLLGHEAKMALNGKVAIELARSFCPDVVLLDIGMPEMNGYEICKLMNLEPTLKNTIFIAHTGWGEREHRQKSKEAGFHYHLVKPMDIEELKNILSRLDKKLAS